MTQLASRRRSHGFFARLALAHDVWQQRQSLRQLTDAQLQDLGLSSRAAFDEARKPLWNLPRHAQRATVWDVPRYWRQNECN